MDSRWSHFWRVAPALMAIIVDYMGYGLVYPLVTAMFTSVGGVVFPHIDSIHLRDLYLSLAYLLYPLGMFLGASVLGDLSDMWGRKKVILVALAGIFISFLLMSTGIIIKSIFVFLAGRLLSGLMAGSQPLAQAAIADISTPKTKAWNMALVTLVNCIGIILGPMIAGIFSETWFLTDVGYSPPFLVAAFLALIAFAWVYLKFKETYVVSGKKKIDWTRPVRIFIEAAQHKQVRLLLLITLLFQTAVGIYFQTLGIYFSSYFHYSSSLLGFFYAFLGASFVFSNLWVYPFALKHMKLEPIVIYGFLVLGVIESIVGFVTIDWVIWALVFVMACANIAAWTALITVVSNAVDATRQGWVMGVFSAMVAVGFIIAGLTSNVLPWIGSSGVIFAGGIIALLSCLFMVVYRQKQR